MLKPQLLIPIIVETLSISHACSCLDNQLLEALFGIFASLQLSIRHLPNKHDA